MKANLSIRSYDSFESCSSLHAEMRRINAASPRPCPFSTPEFLANHIKHNGVSPGVPGGRPLLLMAFRGETLVGYVALRRVRDRPFGRVREKIDFLVTHDRDRPHLVAREKDQAECAAAICRHLRENEPDWTFLEFEEQDETSPFHTLRESFDKEYYARWSENASNATIEGDYPSLEAYFKTFSKKMRSNVSRYARRLFDAGDVQLVSSSAPGALAGLLDVYRSVERRSWKNGIDWVVGDEPHRLAFFRELMRPGQPMRIRVSILALDGCPIAAIINGRYLNRMYALQIAYDEDYADLDPGAMMLLASMKSAIDERCVAYDLLSGYGYFKERWLARITPSRSVQVYRTGTLHHFKAILGEYKRHVVACCDAQIAAKANPVKECIRERGEREAHSAVNEALRAESARLLSELRTSSGLLQTLSHEALVDAMPFAAAPAQTRRHDVLATAS